MLVLRRKNGEGIWINKGEIKVYVLGVEGNRVKLGIDAPQDLDIVREELVESLAPSPPAKHKEGTRA